MSYPHPHYLQPYPPAPQPAQVPPPWPLHGVWPASYPPAPPAGNQRRFQVRIRKHTGLAILMLNQTYTVTGTFAECEAALRGALVHNLLLGWWSLASLLIWNWVALVENHSARTTLRRQAAQAHTAPTQARWQRPSTVTDPQGFRP
ncbi:hypothetical protein [Mycobacterium kansasii]|uniref:hypothetical protein n=1 Tax=Mycobacterium kansasii TaxID=1768 RepID=UPI00068D714E|nr:hypothetical protein [Mycobacterium kansasii]